MTRLLIAGLACIGLIALLTLVTSRLIRSRRRGFSIRMQVFLALAGIVGAFAFGLGILVVDRVEARAQRLAVAAAQDEAHAIAAILRSEMKRSGVSFSELANELAIGSSGRASLGALGEESTGRDITGLGVELLSLDERVLFPARTKSQAQEKGAVFVDRRIMLEDKPLGIVRVVKPTIVVEAMLADFAPTVLVISLVLGAAAAGAAAFIGRTIAAPIESLSEYTQRVSLGERPKLPAQVIGREVGRLVSSIDTMRERLEGRPFVETFAADLSHELKNPVAAIRASAEVLQEGALQEPEQAARFVLRIHEAAVRIERLLAELLSLAEVETRGPAHLDLVELSPLVDQILRTYGADAQRVDVHTKAAPALRGDRGWLTRALTNLVDNALVHSPPDSRVTIELRANEREVEIVTTNDGYLDKHIEKSLFKRFVTTRREKGGTGLGLSIVRAVAEAHGGHIELLGSEAGKVRFQLRFPADETGLRPSA